MRSGVRCRTRVRWCSRLGRAIDRSLIGLFVRGLYLEHSLVSLDSERAHVVGDVWCPATLVVGVEGDMRAVISPDGNDHGVSSGSPSRNRTSASCSSTCSRGGRLSISVSRSCRRSRSISSSALVHTTTLSLLTHTPARSSRTAGGRARWRGAATRRASAGGESRRPATVLQMSLLTVSPTLPGGACMRVPKYRPTATGASLDPEAGSWPAVPRRHTWRLWARSACSDHAISRTGRPAQADRGHSMYAWIC